MKFNRKLDQLYSEENGLPKGSYPFSQFNPQSIFEGIIAKNQYSDDSAYRMSEILLDIKYLYYCIEVAFRIFYNGSARVTGNGNIDAFSLNSMRYLQEIHYRVYLISSIYERILDLLELVYFNQIKDQRKDKWGYKFKKLSSHKDFAIINSEHNDLLIAFRDQYRRGELHSVSSVLRRLYDNKGWYNFTNETTTIKSILSNIIDQFSDH